MAIKQSVLNTFARVGIDYLGLDNNQKTEIVNNWLTGEEARVTPLIARCINFVYDTTLAYERGDRSITLSDFDRIRYFVLDVDQKAYMTCLD